MIIRRIDKTEYKEIANVHLKGFKDFFLSSLGAKFLETYYNACLKDDKTIALCACDDNGSISGFAVGSTLAKGFHKHLITKKATANLIEIL